MPVTYRRAHGSDTWHFRDDCCEWPEGDFDQEAGTPSSGVCCLECTYWPASTFSRTAARTRLLAPSLQSWNHR